MNIDKLTDTVKNWDTFTKIAVSIISIIMLLLIVPLTSYIDRNDERITRIEQQELPRIKSEQSEMKVHIMQTNTRLEAQTEIIKKIADDVEYIRRRMEGE